MFTAPRAPITCAVHQSLVHHSLVHGFEERVLSVQAVVLAGANIHVSIRVGAVLRGESIAVPVIPGDFDDVVAQHHDVVAMQSGVFFADSVVVLDGVQRARMHALEPVPIHSMMSGVHFIQSCR